MYSVYVYSLAKGILTWGKLTSSTRGDFPAFKDILLPGQIIKLSQSAVRYQSFSPDPLTPAIVLFVVPVHSYIQLSLY